MQHLVHRSLGTVLKRSIPDIRSFVPDCAGNLDHCSHIATGVMDDVLREAVGLRHEAKPKGIASAFVNRPFQCVMRERPHRINERHHIHSVVSVHLRPVRRGVKVLVQRMPQHFLVERNAVVSGPRAGTPASDQFGDRPRELEKRLPGGVGQIRWSHAGNCQSPRRRQQMRRKSAPDIEFIQRLQLIIGQNGRELERLVVGRVGSGCFKIVKCERHVSFSSLFGPSSATVPLLARRNPSILCLRMLLFIVALNEEWHHAAEMKNRNFKSEGPSAQLHCIDIVDTNIKWSWFIKNGSVCPNVCETFR